MPEVVAGLVHGAQHCGPIFKVCRKDLGGHVAGQLGDKTVEHHGRVAHLICQPGPVEIARFPGLAEQAAGIASKEGERLHVEQLAPLVRASAG